MFLHGSQNGDGANSSGREFAMQIYRYMWPTMRSIAPKQIRWKIAKQSTIMPKIKHIMQIIYFIEPQQMHTQFSLYFFVCLNARRCMAAYAYWWI